jgi:hypothetical protein
LPGVLAGLPKMINQTPLTEAIINPQPPAGAR